MKLENGKSYGFGDLFSTSEDDIKGITDTPTNLRKQVVDDAVSQWLEDPSTLIYVCRRYIGFYQTILDIIYIPLIIASALLSIFLSYKFGAIFVSVVFLGRLITSQIQWNHLFIKNTAVKFDKRTKGYINEYLNNNS